MKEKFIKKKESEINSKIIFDTPKKISSKYIDPKIQNDFALLYNNFIKIFNNYINEKSTNKSLNSEINKLKNEIINLKKELENKTKKEEKSLNNLEISSEIKIEYEKQIKVSNISFDNVKRIKENKICNNFEIKYNNQPKEFKDLIIIKKRFSLKNEIQNLNINLEMANGQNGTNKEKEEEEETDLDRIIKGDDVEEEIINPIDYHRKERSNTTYQSSKKMQLDIHGSYKFNKDDGKNGKKGKKK